MKLFSKDGLIVFLTLVCVAVGGVSYGRSQAGHLAWEQAKASAQVETHALETLLKANALQNEAVKNLWSQVGTASETETQALKDLLRETKTGTRAMRELQREVHGAGQLVTGDQTSIFPTSPRICASPAFSTVGLTVAGGAVAVPTTSAAGRRFVTICNSAENAAGKVKCTSDGTTVPVMGVGNAGDVLLVGDCVTYAVSSGVAVDCITDTTTTYVTATECR